jgi:glucose/mannose-6-phosphate isomerase
MNTNLDDPLTYKKLDPSDMLGHLRRMPQECQKAWQEGLNLALPADYAGVNKVVISGMGGSAIGGDLARVLVEPRRVPLWVSRDYQPPPFLDSQTLFIASSYSGMTEETLSAFEMALNTPAKKLVVTTGGKLRARAQEKNIPTFVYDYPAQPRAALAYGFLSLLGIFQKLGLLGDISGDVAEMVSTMEKLAKCINEKVALPANPAKELASKLVGHLAFVYGAGVLAPVAHRWKTQLNENSKAWAFNETLPELNHNAVVGYEFPQEMAGKAFAVLLRSPSLHQRILLRYQITAEILARSGVSHQVIDAEGNQPLSQMMSLVMLGDYVSYYLALLYGVDPSPVKVIDYLKAKLGPK